MSGTPAPAGAAPATPTAADRVAAQRTAGDVAPDEASAAALAYRTRRPVLVSGRTSESSRTWAQPDGTFRSEVSLAPERVRDGSGWREIDLSLERRSDGSVAPRVHARGVVLSGARSAGSDRLVSLGRGADAVALGWRGALPEPVLSGNRATYRQVRPDVDLIVEVQPAGFQYFLEVRTPQAAAGLTSVSMPWRTGGMSRTAAAPGTTLRYAAESGAKVVVSSAQMWDASVSPRAGEHARVAPVGVQVRGAGDAAELVLTPDAKMLADPTARYPITIDPSVNLNPSFDAFVQNTYSSDQSGDEDLKLGWNDDADAGCGSGCTARSFLSFGGLGGYSGATVVSAELFLWNYHSWSCTAARWESWRTGAVSTATRWTNQPSWIEQDGSSTGTKGYGGCGAGWVSVSVKKTFQTAVSAGASTATVGLRADSESNHNGWKRFRSANASSGRPYVTLVYNRTPAAPTTQTIDSCYTACGSPAIVRSGTPTISAKVADPDGGTLRAEYEVYDNAKVTIKARSGTAVTGVKSGTAKPWRIVPVSGARLPDGTYHWRARACDTYTCGGYSGWFTFTVDTTDPSLPTVSSTSYPEKATGTWSGGPGQAGDFIFGANGATEITQYVYSLNGGNAVTLSAGPAAGTQILSTNQQTVASGTTGFWGINALPLGSSLGHNASGSLLVQPTHTSIDSYAYFLDSRGKQLGMQPGRRYSLSGWVNVSSEARQATKSPYAFRIVLRYQDEDGWHMAMSNQASKTGVWEQLTLSTTLPAGMTAAEIRLYNGTAMKEGGVLLNKPVYYDDLSVIEEGGLVRSITPDRDGVNVLSVQARNAAGVTSDPRVFQFLVMPSTGSWHWALDEGTGTTAASLPEGRTATLSPGATWTSPGRVGAGAVNLDGLSSATTVSPVLDTSSPAGFTVATWARKSSTGGSVQTAVSQDGTETSMFRLGYRADRDLDADGVNDPVWCFSLARSDVAGAREDSACTTDYVVDDDWVSLVGVYDDVTGQIRLYVNGTPDLGGTLVTATAVDGAWSATGSFVMGRGQDSASPTEPWTGDLDHVYASQYVWSESEIVQHVIS
ncbi:DNRLRE domain-containing protein [Micromonospora sp. NPDC050980]|uniref:DNRLRE domain-containing protein n=1 Tax=Micromonospora sp. NPDC050980 TaxID=3155161 RepID=UPI0033C5360A